VSDSLYGEMVEESSEGKWYCSNCTAMFSPSVRSSKPLVNTGLLSCVCFNASVMSKRFDFLAYICAHRFDVVAVTETFLDDSVHDFHVTPPGYAVFRHDRNQHGGDVMILGS